MARNKLLHNQNDTDPMGTVANLFDVAMVFAVALMVALVSRFNMTEIFSKEDYTMVKNPGQENMEIITKEGIAKLTLLGNPEAIKAKAEALGVCLCGVDIVNPVASPDFGRYVNEFYEMRKAKGMTPEKAEATMKDTMFFGAMMLYDDKVDGMVAGAIKG